jgi:putative spermidine/putrescine transport system ATP-binding protein
MLELKEIHVSLDKKAILTDINLSIKSGEFVTLLGPSGCGKSTLLKTICGLVDISSGYILDDDEIINNSPPNKRNMVLVFQDLRLFPNMNVIDNVAFPLKISGLGKNERREQAEALLDSVGLRNYSKYPVSKLSGGQQQRVALARGLAAKPKYLFLDEAFAGLDQNLRIEMGKLLKSLHEKFKMTTIFVTHSREEALKLSDRIVVMDNGKITECVTPREIFDREESVEAYKDGVKVRVMIDWEKAIYF